MGDEGGRRQHEEGRKELLKTVLPLGLSRERGVRPPDGRPLPAPPDWGVTLLELMIVVLLISIIAAIVIPKLTESKTSANETSAIATMKVLVGAQAQFREADRDRDSHLDYATDLAELSSAGLIDNVLGAGRKSGYLFGLSGSTYEWKATATPADVNVGRRKFYVDTTGVIRFSRSGTPDSNSSPIGE